MAEINDTNKNGAIPSIRECLSSLVGYTTLPKDFLLGLPDSDDWSLIIKLHLLVELSLNHLITAALGDDRISEIIGHMDTSDKQRGKMAFVKSLELLPKEARVFVSKLSELRNKLVHNLSHFNFSLSKWVKEMTPQDLTNFTQSLNFDCNGKTHEFWYSLNKDAFRKLSDSDLKEVLIFTCLSILWVALDKVVDEHLKPLVFQQKRLQALSDSFQAGNIVWNQES